MEERDLVCESVPLGIPVYRERARRVRVRATTTNKILNLSINSERTDRVTAYKIRTHDEHTFDMVHIVSLVVVK